MGLDMYLRREISGLEEDGVMEKINERLEAIGVKETNNIELNLVQEVLYWRKFNALHEYIFKQYGGEEDNCTKIYLGVEELRDICDLLREIVRVAKLKDGKIVNANEVARLLPTAEGFFWGSTDYDEYYYNEVKSTVEELERLLVEDKKLKDCGLETKYYYYAWY